ncbi:porin [Pandoraea commovens]|uniref:Porin n=1 Tax=Pandoraea commovens TaxID=2508289 RepID=A0ABY5QIC7_9BURK|nr:porin [Pandoraea commovens]UVA80551.1 porin [Pandoraea commovens]
MYKKACTALALAQCAGASWAQTGPTLSGFVDSYVESIRAQNTTAQRLQSGGLQTSRFVFRDVEKITDTLEAQAVLEWRLRVNNGTTPVPPARDAYVALKGEFGRFLLGRMRVTSATTYGRIDPTYTGNYSVITNVIASYERWLENNTVKYESPKWQGFQVISSLSLGKQGENLQPGERPKSGQGTSTGLRYSTGPWFASVVYDNFNNARPGEGMQDVWLVGEYWIRGQYKITAALHRYSGVYTSGKPSQQGFDWQIGGRYSITPANELVVSLVNRNEAGSSNGDATGLYVGIEHSLSKRTRLYASYARINNRGNSRYALAFDMVPMPGENTSAVALGISHAF